MKPYNYEQILFMNSLAHLTKESYEALCKTYSFTFKMAKLFNLPEKAIRSKIKEVLDKQS